MKRYRTLLFIPGNREDMLRKGPTTAADGLLPDLEDAVPLKDKQAARELVGRFVGRVEAKPCFVRVNSVPSGETLRDLETIVSSRLVGIFLPKVESVDEVKQVSTWLDQLEPAVGVRQGHTEMVLMMESALGVRRAYDLATASNRVASLSFASGQNGDLQTDLGCDWSVEGTELLYARSKVLLDARAAGIEFPLDGVYVELTNEAGLIADTTLSKRLGYKGRSVIHPKQIDAVNHIYSPSPDEVAYYRRLITAFDEAERQGRASINFEGRMVDYAMVMRARRVIDLSELSAT